jgi:hypothetical protein
MLIMGMAFCALSVWAAFAYSHNQSEFRAVAVPARAVIDKVYAANLYHGNSGWTFDQYALVHFETRRGTVHAQVLLAVACRGSCLPVYRAGQMLTVYYSPQNMSYAQLSAKAKLSSNSDWGAIIIFGIVGLVTVAIAASNILKAARAS